LYVVDETVDLGCHLKLSSDGGYWWSEFWLSKLVGVV
jgi:hypothetical protein